MNTPLNLMMNITKKEAVQKRNQSTVLPGCRPGAEALYLVVKVENTIGIM